MCRYARSWLFLDGQFMRRTGCFERGGKTQCSLVEHKFLQWRSGQAGQAWMFRLFWNSDDYESKAITYLPQKEGLNGKNTSIARIPPILWPFASQTTKSHGRITSVTVSTSPRQNTSEPAFSTWAEMAQQIGMDFARKHFSGYHCIVATHDHASHHSSNVLVHIIHDYCITIVFLFAIWKRLFYRRLVVRIISERLLIIKNLHISAHSQYKAYMFKYPDLILQQSSCFF